MDRFTIEVSERLSGFRVAVKDNETQQRYIPKKVNRWDGYSTESYSTAEQAQKVGEELRKLLGESGSLVVGSAILLRIDVVFDVNTKKFVKQESDYRFGFLVSESDAMRIINNKGEQC